MNINTALNVMIPECQAFLKTPQNTTETPFGFLFFLFLFLFFFKFCVLCAIGGCFFLYFLLFLFHSDTIMHVLCVCVCVCLFAYFPTVSRAGVAELFDLFECGLVTTNR